MVKMVDCQACDGTGTLSVPRYGSTESIKCPHCNGTGKVPDLNIGDWHKLPNHSNQIMKPVSGIDMDAGIDLISENGQKEYLHASVMKGAIHTPAYKPKIQVGQLWTLEPKLKNKGQLVIAEITDIRDRIHYSTIPYRGWGTAIVEELQQYIGNPEGSVKGLATLLRYSGFD